MSDYRIIQGDCREVLPELEEGSVDVICTDPPYSWQFMQATWDKALPDPAVWKQCLRVLKPGAFAFVMSGPRSDCLWRLCRDLEEAGFDLAHSQIHHVFRQGFPKSLNISADFDRAAFTEWLKSVLETVPCPDHKEIKSNGTSTGVCMWCEALWHWQGQLTRQYARKVVSAAVNGACPAFHDRSANSSIYQRGNGATDGAFDSVYARSRHSLGTRLLSSLLACHWEPLPEEQKREAWQPYAQEPDWSLPPGVRVKVGYSNTRVPKHSEDTGRYHISKTRHLQDTDETGQGYITAPSTDLAKQWDGWHSGGGLKPAWEAIIVAQKPFKGPVRENVRRHGVGGFNVEAGRIPFGEEGPWNCPDSPRSNLGHKLSGGNEDRVSASPAGRYPANLLVSDNACGNGSRYFDLDAWAREHGFDEDGWVEAAQAGLLQIAKAAKGEKEAGCMDLPLHDMSEVYSGGMDGASIPLRGSRPPKYQNPHTTVKPVRLFSYLIHLACPPGGLVLDPFLGSGTTAVAAIQGGFRSVGIELEPEYVRIAEARCRHTEAKKQEVLF